MLAASVPDCEKLRLDQVVADAAALICDFARGEVGV